MHRFTSKAIGLLLSSAFSIIIIVCLFRYSKIINHKNNHFTRLFPPHFLTNPKQMNLPYNSFYLAGLTHSSIYLGNSTDATLLLKTNFNLNTSENIPLHTPTGIKVVVSAIKIFIDSPYIYMMEGITPKVFNGNLHDTILITNKYQKITFNAFNIISNKSYVIRSYDPIINKNILIKSSFSESKTEIFKNILTSGEDGVFSLDGMLVKDRQTHNIVYLYYYRNEFLYLDSNLNILFKGKTIDSIHNPEIKLSKIISTGATTFSAPPLTVNRTSCADSRFLYVNSKLKAKNEDESSFENNSVIDIYSLKNGDYVYSFYIPDHLSYKMKSFQIINHNLVALYDHSLMTFSLQY